jgi:hypothetical protein
MNDAVQKYKRWKDRLSVAVYAYALFLLVFLALPDSRTFGGEADAAAHFRESVEPILKTYCYGCHAEGEKNGEIAFDAFKSDAELVASHGVWSRVLKNVRAGIMPPAGEDRPTAEELRRVENWIKYQSFALDPKNPDPGRVTIRRLNRAEYRNTIRDLMGIDFKADEEFPPDDTGYGFDNIGDVLTVSPLLLEKYMQAAESIVATAVPVVDNVVRESRIAGTDLRDADGKRNEQLSLYNPAKVSRAFEAPAAGEYRVEVDMNVRGAFDHDPARANVIFTIDGKERWKDELDWEDNKKVTFKLDETWEAGEHQIALELQPLTPVEEKKSSVDLRINSVRIEGPMAKEHWVRPKNFDRFFTKDAPSETAERREYAREILGRFTKKAFRRPVDDRTIDRLVAIAEESFNEPGKSFAEGVARAMVAVLSSPRFIFRIEGDQAGGSADSFPAVDEYALAVRLSYFLWSTMPDDELFGLAERGELRSNLPAQLKRMLADSRRDALIENFTGQWLQVRDIEGVPIDSRAVLFRELDRSSEAFREIEGFRRGRANGQRRQADGKQQPENPADGKQAQAKPAAADGKQPAQAEKRDNAKQPERQQQREGQRRFRFNRPRVEFDRELRLAMKRETEMAFAYVLREDRSALELIDSDYTFLNERLAKHYGIPDVLGRDMRRVTLPADSPRGGVLTHGAVLAVTSNPTRTSPVKRGLFILDNIIGSAPPPPPADVPDLEESEKEFKDREPALREVLELHRSNALCNSCHSRMDPLGLALENFNAMGMWREKERNQPIDAAGELITGEAFQGVRDLKRILKENRRADFYRCLTEKMLTYALGRGLEHYDVETVDRIVERLEQENGRVSVLFSGIVESAPFQKRRNLTALAANQTDQTQNPAESKVQP